MGVRTPMKEKGRRNAHNSTTTTLNNQEHKQTTYITALSRLLLRIWVLGFLRSVALRLRNECVALE
jgi:hypothetical protein